ncbi:hypothetical protein KKI24_27675 [bacterium]|nr:hypothetical protein [bacterium]
MTTDFTLNLLITFKDIQARAIDLRDELEDLDSSQRDSILQFVHDFCYLPSDSSTPGDSLCPANLIKQLQINVGAWYASFAMDNPAGTGSLSSVSIDSFSVSNTMAKNNATADDLINANQYGTMVYWIMSQVPQRYMMI